MAQRRARFHLSPFRRNECDGVFGLGTALSLFKVKINSTVKYRIRQRYTQVNIRKKRIFTHNDLKDVQGAFGTRHTCGAWGILQDVCNIILRPFEPDI